MTGQNGQLLVAAKKKVSVCTTSKCVGRQALCRQIRGRPFSSTAPNVYSGRLARDPLAVTKTKTFARESRRDASFLEVFDVRRP